MNGMQKPIIDIHPEQKGHELGDLYGLFFEDLNHAADGGLYAEMVQNRSFEYSPIDRHDYHALYGWMNENGDPLEAEKLTLRVLNEKPIHPNNPYYVKIDAIRPLMIQNDGYNQGMYFAKNKQYRFSIFARHCMQETAIKVSFRTEDGEIIAEDSCLITTREWEKYEVIITATKTTRQGRLVLEFETGANLAVDMVSLFPVDTFKGRENGCRKDIAEMLETMKPKFMRFPGGCLVHDGSLNSEDRDSMYRWKNTVGPVEHRPSRRNNWGYNQSLGLGFYEYFLLCEDIGAKPIPVLPGGFDPHHQRAVPFEQMDEWVQDALDLVEFANGSIESRWGGLRAEMGHPEPFHLEYIAIGNEEVGQAFFDRYVYFHRALREKHPDIQMINSAGPFAAGSEFDRGWDSAREHGSDLVDEHYYQPVDWMLANHERYDTYDANGPKVFLGEYASWGNEWYNAVVEASYMIGLERNADKVALACYAPMLANIDHVNWRPDLIWFDQEKVYGSQNYYIQKLFMEKQGVRNIGWSAKHLPETEVIGEPSIHGEIGLAGDWATIAYENMKVIDHQSGKERIIPNGTIDTDQYHPLTNMESSHYTISFEFEKVGGRWDKGFRFVFGKQDDKNELCWLLGGWQNQDSIIRNVHDGRISDLTQRIWKVEENQRYDCKITIENRQITAWINGMLFNQTEAKLPKKQPVYVNAVEDGQGNKIVKLVNVKDQAITIDLHCAGNKAIIETIYGEKSALNSLENPKNFSSQTEEISLDDASVEIEVPALGIVFVTVE